MKSHNYNGAYAFKKAITWTKISSEYFACRYVSNGFMFDDAGPICSVSVDDIYSILALLNSKVGTYYLSILSPTMNFLPGHINNVPINYEKLKNNMRCSELSMKNVEIEKNDWDSFETSWDFKEQPLIRNKPFTHKEMEEDLKHNIHDMNLISEAYNRWQNECYLRFTELKKNEEELNRIFIDIYSLQDELTPEVEDKDITVRKADLGREVRSFVSYAVGCMFGRYSLDEEGLIYAGGEWDSSRYQTFLPDDDNCIPITDEEYFSDDIVGRFVEFVKTVYGADTLEENLDFIANALGNKGDTSREVIRNYFLKDFYADHLKVYQKRPIYWLFDSGKQNGFKALIYMHRYDADTVGRVRTDYLHRAQKYVETAMQSAQYTIDNASSASEKSKATKAVTKYTKQLAEMKIYDEAIAHIANQRIEIDLDDGVKVNYAKFQGVEVAQEGKKALKVDLLAKLK